MGVKMLHDKHGKPLTLQKYSITRPYFSMTKGEILVIAHEQRVD